MKIKNDTNTPLIAFTWDKKNRRWYGLDTTIPPGETVDVQGPYVGAMDGGACYLVVGGDIICHTTEDDPQIGAYQVLPGAPLALTVKADKSCGVTVRHFGDHMPPEVAHMQAVAAYAARALA